MESQNIEISDFKYKIKVAKDTDKNSFMDLWKICFKDTQNFIDFFFSKRFFPEYSVCVEHNGEIVSAMQSMPLNLIIRGKEISASIIAGVCTHPDFRGKGLMKEMIKYYVNYAKNLGFTAITYKPENLKTYASLSHYATTGNLRYRTKNAYPKIIGSPLHNEIYISNDTNEDQREDFSQTYVIRDLSKIDSKTMEKCFNLYNILAPSYSGIVKRTHENFSLKMEDYASVDAKILIYSVDNHIQSYCCYFDTKDEIYAEEFMATSDNDLLYVLDRLHEIANGRKLTAKIPSNFTQIPESFFPDSDNVSFVDQNVLGITKLHEFIKILDFSRYTSSKELKKYAFDIVDPISDENTGVFDLNGDISKVKPFIKMDIGAFVQFACGYYSIYDFENYKTKTAKILNTELAEKIYDIIPTANCFIVDEY